MLFRSSSHSSHRLLPWSGQGHLSGEESRQYEVAAPTEGEDTGDAAEPVASSQELNSESETTPSEALREVEIDAQILR